MGKIIWPITGLMKSPVVGGDITKGPGSTRSGSLGATPRRFRLYVSRGVLQLPVRILPGWIFDLPRDAFGTALYKIIGVYKF